MATVQFSDPEDFLEELEQDKERVERKIIRLCFMYAPSKVSPNIRHLSVVATALGEGQVIRLRYYCGDVWNIESQDKAVQDEAEKVKKQIADGCARLGLEVRGGTITE